MSLISNIYAPANHVGWDCVQLDPSGITLAQMKVEVLSREGVQGIALRDRGRKGDPFTIPFIITNRTLADVQDDVSQLRRDLVGQLVIITHHTGTSWENLFVFDIQPIPGGTQEMALLQGGVRSTDLAAARMKMTAIHVGYV